MGDQKPVFAKGIGGKRSLTTNIARAVVAMLEEHNYEAAKAACGTTLDANRDRITHFAQRCRDLGHTKNSVVIVIISVDDKHGGPLADVLMPGHDWQQYRDVGQIPFARGLASRKGIQRALDMFDTEAASTLRAADYLAVVVVDHGVAKVFDTPEAR